MVDLKYINLDLGPSQPKPKSGPKLQHFAHQSCLEFVIHDFPDDEHAVQSLCGDARRDVDAAVVQGQVLQGCSRAAIQ